MCCTAYIWYSDAQLEPSCKGCTISLVLPLSFALHSLHRSGAALCFGVHAEACDSECGCRPHSTFIIWFCRAFRDFSCFVGKVVPFVLIRRGLLFSAIVRRMSPADLGDPGETGRARLTWAAWIPWEIKILHQKWLWIGGMTIWMDGCIAGWIMRTNISPRFIPKPKLLKW